MLLYVRNCGFKCVKVTNSSQQETGENAGTGVRTGSSEVEKMKM